MKKLFASRGFAAVVLVIVALAAIPLLGGLKLSAAQRRNEKQLEAATHADKFDITNDIKTSLSYAEKLLQEGKKLAGSESSSSVDLESAVKACSEAETNADKYSKCLELIDKANAYSGSLGKLSSTTFDDLLSAINSQRDRIVNGYREAYNTYEAETGKLLNGFPASLIAKLFNIKG
ncbi:MAG: hypothetical protein IKS90_02245 [Clostridia bacterium]|nr:hypothetical protein [Clostridia bacterium]